MRWGSQASHGEHREKSVLCPLLGGAQLCSAPRVGTHSQASSYGWPQAGLNVIKESEAQLWWAAKELRRTKKLSDYVGKNEKTKIIAKIQQVSTFCFNMSIFFVISLQTDKNVQ